MGNVKIDTGYQKFLAGGMVAMLAMGGAGLYAALNQPEVVATCDADGIAQAVVGSIVLPVENTTAVADQIEAIHAEMFDEDTVEAVAETLVLDELDSRDFKKFLIANLNDSISELEDVDYRDITNIDVRDIDVDTDGDEATVTVDLKVYVNNYGDEDEEEKARVSVTFNVEDLDSDDDFEDAEVKDFGDFELIKFYN